MLCKNKHVASNGEASSALPNSKILTLYGYIALQLWERFERLGSIDSLNEAIVMYEHTVELTSQYHPNRCGYLTNPGIAHRSRFERSGSIDDLNGVISTKEQVIASTPGDHPNSSGHLNNLGNALHSRIDLEVIN